MVRDDGKEFEVKIARSTSPPRQAWRQSSRYPREYFVSILIAERKSLGRGASTVITADSGD